MLTIDTPYGAIPLVPGTKVCDEFYAMLDDWKEGGGNHEELIPRVEAWAQVASGVVDPDVCDISLPAEVARGVEQLC